MYSDTMTRGNGLQTPTPWLIEATETARIRSYAAYARAQAQAIHKTIAATAGIEDVAAMKAEATETAQTFAKVGIYADQRIGELLRELPKAKGNQYTSANSTEVEKAPTKADALKDAGIPAPTAYQLEQLAANPEIVEAVIARAEADGRIPSRAQVLRAIKAEKARERMVEGGRAGNVPCLLEQLATRRGVRSTKKWSRGERDGEV
jgi:hypothetical protein